MLDRAAVPAASQVNRHAPPWHQHQPLELGHERAVLIEHAGVDLDRAAVGFGRDSRSSQHLGLANSVSPWKTGAGWLSSSVARFAIALPEMSLTLMPRASEYT